MPTVRNVVVLVCLFSSGFFAFAQQLTIKTVTAKYTSATSGQEMYHQYCAVCHGATAKGDGPAVPALKNHPPDLTLLAKQNGGKFPGNHVVNVLKFGTETTAHGNATMPVWGPIFSSLHKSNPTEAMQRANNVSRYLQTLQVQ